MNYKPIYDSILYRAKSEQENFSRPKTRFAKNCDKFCWLKIENYTYPLTPKEAFLIHLISKKVVNHNQKLDGSLNCKSARDFEKFFNERKRLKAICKKCGNQIRKPNKTGLCEICRPPRVGELSSFFGKHHSKETKEKLHNSSSISSKRNWQNPEYRQKVISHATGLKRSEEFKEKQRKNTLKQFEDESQRILRSKKMKEIWENGNLVPHNRPNGHNFSKQELQFGEDLRKALKENSIFLKRQQVIKMPNSSKFYLPDFLFKEKYVIEYLGDYWHANPKNYKADDWIEYYGGKCQAKDIWQKDEKRRKNIQDLSYIIIEVWGSDYQSNPETCIENVLKQILQ